MCGIAGIVRNNADEIYTERLKKMTDIIAHRGPDGEGHWINKEGNVGLGHRRLSIIDLSHNGDQPMHYLDRYSIVFNGEVYNYVELKEVLIKQGYHFKTESDTEVLMALYHRDKENCLQSLDGMFAFVIYDEQTKEIFAARDRFGEKPFFYNYKRGSHFIFGSEMKCLWEAGIEKKVNYKMLYNYLVNGDIDNPGDPSETFYENCTRLPHSHYIKFSSDKCELSVKQYYDIDWQNTNHSITLNEAKEKFHELFYTSVMRRLRSDVPVGSSLSGGLDSSLVVAVIDALKKGGTQRQGTFSAVFPGFKKDERKYMDYVIASTNVSPHFITPGDEGLIASIDKLCWHQEEPFGSASIYVQYCVMELAKANNVTVLMDGQGADEILAGYHSFYPPYFTELKKMDPLLYQQELVAYANKYSNSDINKDIRKGFISNIKTATGNFSPTLKEWYRRYKHFKNPTLNRDFYNTYNMSTFKDNPTYNTLNGALYGSTFKKGLQDLLRYADRNSMAHSREVRLPFLYHELVEFLLTLPAQMKIQQGWTKWIMRQTFEKELPPQICWRVDKIGYEPPQQNWMQSEEVKAKIIAAKNILIEQQVLLKSVLNSNEETKNNSVNNWQLWMIGEIMK
jgi:asparagine synthase (glutamine-hydrolysing)